MKRPQGKPNKVKACVYPLKWGCRGCEYNYLPELYDGGCMLEFPPKKGEERGDNGK